MIKMKKKIDLQELKYKGKFLIKNKNNIFKKLNKIFNK